MDNQPVYGTITGVLTNVRSLSFHDSVKNVDVPYIEVEFDNPTGFGSASRYVFLGMKDTLYKELGLAKPETLNKYKDKLVRANLVFESRQGKLKVSIISGFTVLSSEK